MGFLTLYPGLCGVGIIITDVYRVHLNWWWQNSTKETNFTIRFGVGKQAARECFLRNRWNGVFQIILFFVVVAVDRSIICLQQVLPDLFRVLPYRSRAITQFQNDREPCHYTTNGWDYLDTAFLGHWVGSGNHLPDLPIYPAWTFPSRDI